MDIDSFLTAAYYATAQGYNKITLEQAGTSLATIQQNEYEEWRAKAVKALKYYIDNGKGKSKVYNKVLAIVESGEVTAEQTGFLAFIPKYYEQGVAYDNERQHSQAVMDSIKEEARKHRFPCLLGKRVETDVVVERKEPTFWGTVYLFADVEGRKFFWNCKGVPRFKQGQRLRLRCSVKQNGEFAEMTRCQAV